MVFAYNFKKFNNVNIFMEIIALDFILVTNCIEGFMT